MSNVAEYLRITGLIVTDDDVNKRSKGIANLELSLLKTTDIDQLLGKAADIAIALGGDGAPSAALSFEVQSAMEPYASSYLSAERPLEVGIFSAIAALNIIVPESSPTTAVWTVQNVFAVGLWSALSFQPAVKDTKREKLRSEVLVAAQIHTSKAAESARKRREVLNFADLPLAQETMPTFAAQFKEATTATIGALRHNAMLDREELDFLWWALLDRSRIFKKRLEDLEESTRLIASGIEAADVLCRLPCDVHRDLVLRSTGLDETLSLSSLLKALGSNREVLAARFQGSVAETLPSVFPLLSSVVLNNAGIDGGALERPASEWGARALLEASLVRLRAGRSML